MLSYSHYTLEERKCLQQLRDEGWGIRQIARATGRAPSTVSRELKRNRSKKGYGFWYANNQAIHRRRTSHPMKRLEENSALRDFVQEKLKAFWSPECIAEAWRREHPDDPVSFATIYRWLKRGALPGFSRKTHLRRRGKKIQTRNANYMTIHPDRLIEDWSVRISAIGRGTLSAALSAKVASRPSLIVRVDSCVPPRLQTRSRRIHAWRSKKRSRASLFAAFPSIMVQNSLPLESWKRTSTPLSISLSRTLPGSVAPTKTPTGYCASSSPRAVTSLPLLTSSCRPLLISSITVLANASVGNLPQRYSSPPSMTLTEVHTQGFMPRKSLDYGLGRHILGWHANLAEHRLGSLA